MGKKAIIRLPKDKVANNIQARYVDGEIQVRYDIADKFEPKDGDFLTREKDSIVVIYKDTDYSGGVVSYAGGCCKSKGHISTRTDTGWGYTENYRPATFSETFDFLVRLENEYGKAWDSKNKKLVDVIKPVPGDFLISKNKGIFIFINKIDGLYCGVYEVKDTEGNHNGYTTSVKVASMLELRYATEEEKKEFLDFIRMKFNKEWNSEKLCFDDAYVPKFGDIVRVEIPNRDNERNYIICIFPNKEIPGKSQNYFFNLAGIDLAGGLWINDTIGEYFNKGYVFPASESEKQELFDKLKKVGKRWNPDTKKIEDIRWRANVGQKYWYVDNTTIYEDTELIASDDDERHKRNNYFRTREAAQKVADQIKEIFKNSKPE